MSWSLKEKRVEFLLVQMKKQTDQWLKEDIYEDWQKKNKPKQGYTFKPVRPTRTHDLRKRGKFNY
ncbi:MAG: hypothetical protein EBY07_15145 [Actinobacteria bacterium]|jgi:hypothetical protein|nr:hypothetical protein [Actinomycetota bacterium]